MTDTQYDIFLRQLQDKCEYAGWATDGVKFLDSLKFPVQLGQLEKLKKRGYIEADSGTGWRITITQEGVDFINRGGFTNETYLKEEPIRQAQLANSISEKALSKSSRANTIAIIAIVVAIITAIIGIIVWQFPVAN